MRDTKSDSTKGDDKRASAKDHQQCRTSKADGENGASFASVNGSCDQWSLEDGKSVTVMEDTSVEEMSFRPEDQEDLWQKNPHLSLDLSSVDSYELGDSGSQMADSLPSTPSPIDNTKTFSGQLDKEPNAAEDLVFAADLSLFEIHEVHG